MQRNINDMKKKIIFIFFITIFANGIFASSISLACFQNKDADELAEEISKKFEEALFEPFFDSGYIATSIPLAEIKSEKNIKISKLKKNFEELTDFALIIYLEYGKDPIFNKNLNRKVSDWKKVSICLINFSEEKEIYRKIFYPAKIKGINPKEKVKKLSDIISSEVLSILNKEGK